MVYKAAKVKFHQFHHLPSLCKLNDWILGEVYMSWSSETREQVGTLNFPVIWGSGQWTKWGRYFWRERRWQSETFGVPATMKRYKLCSKTTTTTVLRSHLVEYSIDLLWIHTWSAILSGDGRSRDWFLSESSFVSLEQRLRTD